MHRPLLLLAALVAGTQPLSAQLFGRTPTLELTAQPATATIFRLKQQDNSLVPLGVGTAQFKLEKNDPNVIIVRLDGYREKRRAFPVEAEYKDKAFTIFLDTRIVQISALPYDADIFVNGEPRGQRTMELEVPEGQPTTVELRKQGFAPLRRVYRWEKGGTELPPIRDRLELADRQVSVTVPSGAEILGETDKIGTTEGVVVVKRGTCAAIRVQKPGWVSTERRYCNKDDGTPPPPVADNIPLEGRQVDVNAPQGAKIFVNQKQVGTGAYSLKLSDGSCATVRVEQPGFVASEHEYCNTVQQQGASLPNEAVIKLKPDDSYQASVASDQANVNVTVEVGAGRSEEQAWKLVSSIILQYFDVLENSDRETGYLRTAWQVKSYNDNEVVIRTRIIVKRGSDSPLRYVIKIVSERNRIKGVSPKDDENFVPWDRVLNTYKDIIGEAQARMK